MTPATSFSNGGSSSILRRAGDTPVSQLRGRGTSFEDETPHTTRDLLHDPIDDLRPDHTSSSRRRRVTTDFEDSKSEMTGSVISSLTRSSRLISKKRAKDLKLSEFVATHTSEDNASFQEILAKDRLKLQKSYWWLKEKDLQGTKMMIKGCGDTTSTGRVKFWNYTNKNALMYNPEGLPPKPKNFKEPKKTVATNTRFPGTIETQIMQDIAESMRTPMIRHHSTVAGSSSSSTPMVKGYKLMRTPSPSPNQAGNASPIITWGNIASTPMHLKEEDPIDKFEGEIRQKQSEFRVPDMPLRERLGLRLVDKHKERRLKRKRMQTPSATPIRTPKGNRVVDLSPAAIKVLQARKKKRGQTRSDNQLRASYKSPHIRHRTSSSSRRSRHDHTPDSRSSATPRRM
mmetsp:Transcript_43803/g.72768  ORF Transcript_43803/g.72768 Transcript_43803/m.72768 type:complete len:400 (-) Transcript_43803:93-1292(-)